MAIVRSLLAVLVAFGVAAAPAAPCTMASQTDPASGLAPTHSIHHHGTGTHAAKDIPASGHASHHHHHHHDPMTAHSMDDGGGRVTSPEATGIGGAPVEAAVSMAQAPSEDHNQHHGKRVGGCSVACCVLACQSAMPPSPWVAISFDFRPSRHIATVQDDVADRERPMRIERPPRRIA